MAGQQRNKARNQRRDGGHGTARWFDKRKASNKKLRKQQKASRHGNR